MLPACPLLLLGITSDVTRRGKTYRQGKRELVSLGKGPDRVAEPFFGGGRACGEGAVFRIKRTFGNCLFSICGPRGGVAAIGLPPFDEMREVHAKGPSRREEKGPSHTYKFRGGKQGTRIRSQKMPQRLRPDLTYPKFEPGRLKPLSILPDSIHSRITAAFQEATTRFFILLVGPPWGGIFLVSRVAREFGGYR